jgi:hypothetical protein
MVSGCAAQPYAWTETPVRQPLAAYVFSVPVDEMYRRCGTVHTHGCAKRNYSQGICEVVVGPNPQTWVMTHELAHCAGYDHR